MVNPYKNKHPFFWYVYCILISFTFLLICTKTSPLYPFNDWYDVNAFFTMGKGMMNGKILYRDLFEQKGPYLYFIYGLGYLISHTTFIGIFILEVISFSFFLLYAHKLMNLYLDKKYSIISLPLIAAIILNMTSFVHGGTAEEYCIPLVTISLYYLIKYFKNIYPKPISNKWVLFNGIIAGCVMWIKFNLLGFWFGWMASVFLCTVVSKHYKESIKNCFIFLFGMFIATMPWLIYFGVSGSISQWLYVYIYVNANFYTRDTMLIGRLTKLLLLISKNIYVNPVFGILFLYGAILFIFYKKYIKNKLNRICLLLCMIFFSLGIYGGGRGYAYYFLVFSPFVVLGVIALVDVMDMRFNCKLSISRLIVFAVISVGIMLPLTIKFNSNTSLLKVKKQDLVQYKFANIISETKNPTLLYYGYIDGGFYTTTNIVPNVRFFENQSIAYSKYPLIMDEQDRYIKDKEIDYIVMRKDPSQVLCTSIELPYQNDKDIPYLYENYNLIAEDNQKLDNKDYKYMLFKKK